MSEQLVLELTQAEYAAIEKAARASGKTPGEWAKARLCESLPPDSENGTGEYCIHPDSLELLRQVAERTGRPLEKLAAAWIRDLAPRPRPVLSPEER
jgi:hypothetical protein